MLQNYKMRCSLKDLMSWLCLMPFAPFHTLLQMLSYGGFSHKQLQQFFCPTLWSYKNYEKECFHEFQRDMMLFKSRAKGKSKSLL